MKRLTKRYASHVAVVCDNCKEKGSYCDTSVCRDVMRNRLAEYEDTGLEPKELNEKLNEAYDLGAQSVLRYKGLTWSEAEELLRYRDAEEQGLLVRLPCKVGETVYQVIDDCALPGDCGTKRMCKGCEYRILFIDEVVFHLCELTDNGKLRSGYYPTREEAEKALKILEEL